MQLPSCVPRSKIAAMSGLITTEMEIAHASIQELLLRQHIAEQLGFLLAAASIFISCGAMKCGLRWVP